MPTRAVNSEITLNDRVLAALPADLVLWFQSAQMSLSHRIAHKAPNLAVLLKMVMNARNVSQMELGTNRAKSDGSVIFSGLDHYIPGSNVSGYFSLIANIVQGGRKTAVPSDFIAFVAEVTNLPIELVSAMNAEDDLIRQTFARSNRSASVAPVSPPSEAELAGSFADVPVPTETTEITA